MKVSKHLLKSATLLLISTPAVVSTLRKTRRTTTSNIDEQQQQRRRKLWTHLAHFTDPKTMTAKSDSDDPNYAHAMDESYNFFYDVPSDDWTRMRTIMRDRQGNNHIQRNWKTSPQRYYHENWEVDFSCPHERRIGKMGDGGKWVCDPHRIAAISSIRKMNDGRDAPCLVYSIGSSGKHDFEHGIMDTIGEDVCEIHTFEARKFEDMRIHDVTGEEKRKTKKINFHYGWGLKSSADPPMDGFYSLGETISKLGHIGRTIDIFKIDCEGCEWTTYLDWLSAPVHLSQILVEVHKYNERSDAFFQSIQDAGYVTFHKEPNVLSKGRCLEYAFLKLKPDRPQFDSSALATTKTDYQVAGRESYGFFYDVPGDEWQTAKDIMFDRRSYNHRAVRDWRVSARRFYQDNWEPDFSCPFEMRLGSMGTGGLWVCDPHRVAVLSSIRKTADDQPDPCLVYSFGNIGRHDFEDSVLSVIGDVCEIHKFGGRSPPKDGNEYRLNSDMTEDEIAAAKKVNFHYNWGLRASDDEPRENYYTLEETIKKLGHEGRTIDIFKIDCEGCEWSMYKDWLNAPAYLLQILVEVHGNPKKVDEFFQAIQDGGYATFHKELNYMSDGENFEYSFVKLNVEQS